MAREPLTRSYDHRLHWQGRDTVTVLLITLIYGVLALTHLGSTKAPQTFWHQTANEESLVLDLGEDHDNYAMLYYPGVAYRNFKVETSRDMKTWSDPVWAEVREGMCYQWLYLVPSEGEGESAVFYRGASLDSVEHLSGRYVRITAGSMIRSGEEIRGLLLGEILFRQLTTAQETVTDSDGETYTISVTTSDGDHPIPYTVAGHTRFREGNPLNDPARIRDEQDTCEGEPSWFNSTYFDEIYHARTANELLHGEHVYEYTHPPLGKLMMSACIAVFGMTPFGWRLAGTLVGIAMLPAMYLLVKQLTKRSVPALLAMSLMALDLMHLAQTRIATIDSFPVLFIILSFFFMLRFVQRDIGRPHWDGFRALLPDLGLSGLFFALAVSSKWIGIYAGAGLAVMLFWRLTVHVHRAVTEKRGGERRQELPRMLAVAGASLLTGFLCGLFLASVTETAVLVVLGGTVAALLTFAVLAGIAEAVLYGERGVWGTAWVRCILICCACLVFFILVPAVIYALCFIPVFASEHITGLGPYLSRLVQEQVNIFNYHAQPGLGMDHYYYTPWYEWPIMAKPMYYYAASYMPRGLSMAIFCLGNPAVWWAGQVSLFGMIPLWFLCRRVRRDDALPGPDARPECGIGFILVGFAAQFLPWVLVPRGTYMYHYFASIPFLIVAFAYAFDLAERRWKELAWGLTIAVLTVSVLFFAALLPYAMGFAAPTWYLDIGANLLNIYYR